VFVVGVGCFGVGSCLLPHVPNTRFLKSNLQIIRIGCPLTLCGGRMTFGSRSGMSLHSFLGMSLQSYPAALCLTMLWVV
jgi:hypothetical protein